MDEDGHIEVETVSELAEKRSNVSELAGKNLSDVKDVKQTE